MSDKDYNIKLKSMFKSLKALTLLSVSTIIGVKADDGKDFMIKLMASVQSDSTVEATFKADSPVRYF